MRSPRPQTGSELGWGSSIEVSRQARAAQDALKRNDYTAAISFAERAAKSALKMPELWFLLGYCERLGDALPGFRRRLQSRP